MANILIQFAHPAFSKSRVHKVLMKYCRNLESVTFNDLYEQYPDLHIDVKREKALLLRHDIIILQHPFYWYSGPAIIKQWLDLVLEYNWAYGPQGTALNGKKLLSAISCGAGKEAYSPSGHNHYPVTDFLLPYKQTAFLCRMDWLPPFVVHNTYRIKNESLEKIGKQYAALLQALSRNEFHVSQYPEVDYINELITLDEVR